MKNTMRCLGIIAIAALIAFSFAACENDTISDPAGYNPGGGSSSSLNGSWQGGGSAGSVVLTINGSSGVITQSTISYLNVGTTYMRNLSQTGSLTWTGQEMGINTSTGATGYRDTNITLASNGQSFYSSAFGNTFTKGSSAPSGTAPTITTTSLPDGLVGASYSQSLSASGTTPITWSVQSGSLPSGLTLSTSGTISGTPTSTGTSSFTVRATNAAGSGTRSFSIAITGYNTSSLDGRWLRADNGAIYTISGSTGVFTNTGTSALYQDAASKGYISVGMQAFRNITQTGDNRWTGEILLINFTGTSNATGTAWRSFTMTINSDGRSYNCYAPNSAQVNMTFTRY